VLQIKDFFDGRRVGGGGRRRFGGRPIYFHSIGLRPCAFAFSHMQSTGIWRLETGPRSGGDGLDSETVVVRVANTLTTGLRPGRDGLDTETVVVRAAVDLTDPAAALRLGVDTDRWRGAVGGLDQPGGCAQPRRERGPSEGGAAVDLTDPAAALSLGVNTDQVKGGSRRA